MANERISAAKRRAFGSVSVHMAFQEVCPNKGAGASWEVAFENLRRIVVKLVTVPWATLVSKVEVLKGMVMYAQVLSSGVAFSTPWFGTFEPFI